MVCRGIPTFLIFAPKHTLWVLVITASLRRFERVPTTYVLSKNKKNIKSFSTDIFNFYMWKKNLCILHGWVFVMVLNNTLTMIHVQQPHYISRILRNPVFYHVKTGTYYLGCMLYFVATCRMRVIFRIVDFTSLFCFSILRLWFFFFLKFYSDNEQLYIQSCLKHT